MEKKIVPHSSSGEKELYFDGEFCLHRLSTHKSLFLLGSHDK